MRGCSWHWEGEVTRYACFKEKAVVTRLVDESHRLAGLRVARVEEHARERAVADLTDPSERMAHLDAAGLAAEVDGPEHEYLAANVPDIFGEDLVEFEVSVDLGPPLAHPRVAAIRPSPLFQGGVFRPDLDIRLSVADPVVDVTVIPARKRLADDLDVVPVSHGASIASLHGGVTEHRLRFVGRRGEQTGDRASPLT